MNKLTRKLPLLAMVLAAAACSDSVGPVERAAQPGPKGIRPLAALTCTASLETGSVSCGAPGRDGGPQSVLIGGQNLYVRLTSSNISVAADTFAFDVTVTNLIPQPLGTTDFTTPDSSGVRVFFQSGPTADAGSVTVANPDGTEAFTAGLQPYYQYDGPLPTDSTTAPRRWKLQFTPEVTSFTFTLLISANVPYPHGYVVGNPYVLTLDPGETRTLTGTVFNFVGEELPGEAITWNSSNPFLVSVSGDQAMADSGGRGFAELTASSGPRPNDYTTAVSVCQSTVVTSGHSSSREIAETDCFAAFGTEEFRPSTSFYGDLYRVALTAGQTVTITVDTGDQLDSYLVLAAPLGFPAAANDDADEGDLGVGSRIVFTAGETGVYVFEVSTFEGLATGAYTLGVTID